jgi:hypothetical protein
LFDKERRKMSDPLEEAAAVTEMLLAESLRMRAKVPEKTGLCLACEEPTDGAFCSLECREDYERLERLKTIQGKR